MYIKKIVYCYFIILFFTLFNVISANATNKYVQFNFLVSKYWRADDLISLTNNMYMIIDNNSEKISGKLINEQISSKSIIFQIKMPKGKHNFSFYLEAYRRKRRRSKYSNWSKKLYDFKFSENIRCDIQINKVIDFYEIKRVGSQVAGVKLNTFDEYKKLLSKRTRQAKNKDNLNNFLSALSVGAKAYSNSMRNSSSVRQINNNTKILNTPISNFDTKSISTGNSPKLYGADGQFLGNVNSNKYDPNSISNPYGQYGSRYSTTSINNPYSKYGSKYSSESANNKFSSNSPKLYGADGQFLGNVNSNKYDTKSISNPYGQYGSKYSPTSINNPYSKYGNKYSSESVNNNFGN